LHKFLQGASFHIHSTYTQGDVWMIYNCLTGTRMKMHARRLK